jgi:general secretion pathway protein A
MVHRYSRGIPRLINTICENALITGYSRQVAQITPAMVQQVAADLCLEPALISSAVNTSVPETDGREELLGVWLE